MNLDNYKESLDKAISYAQQEQSLELEVAIKKYKNNDITISKFEKVIALLKGLRGKLINKDIATEEVLDISFGSKDRQIRLSISGNNNIIKYCKQNDYKNINPSFMEFLEKKRVMFINIDDYGIKFNLKRENSIHLGNPNLNNYIRDWKNVEKVFRYKKRYTFKTLDNLFQFDLTVVKSSSTREVRGENKKMLKKDVKPYMRKYVNKPDNIVNFDEWYSKLKDSDNVELIGKKFTKTIPKKTIGSSNVMTNKPSYEIEVEYIGNKIRSGVKPKLNEIREKFIQNLGYVLQTLNDNYFFEPNKTIEEYRSYYTKLMGTYKFQAPQSITLEMKHIAEHDYQDYNNIISIRKDYSITDKADGERNLLVINDNGTAFLVNRKNTIKSLGCKMNNVSNTVIDGEYLTKNRDGKNICLFLVFDIYMYNDEDIRNRILNRSKEDIKKDNDEGKLDTKSRMEYLTDFFDTYNIDYNNKNSSINLELQRKEFHYGDVNNYNVDVLKSINKFKERLEKEDLTDQERSDINIAIKQAKNDSKIFGHAKSIYSKDYIYNIDGLIFTPIYLKVGEEPNVNKANPYGGRWRRSFKWKPSKYNSIDFLIEVVKDADNKDKITYRKYRGLLVPFKEIYLKVGYNDKLHKRFNAFRVVNEMLDYGEEYRPIIFTPTNPYIKDIGKAFIPLINNTLICENGDKIKNGDIIEFRYENKWIPMRLRDSLSPNDFATANNVWRSINYSITLEHISTGNIPVFEDEIYYYNINKRNDISTKSLADFHSYVKKNIITRNSKTRGLLLDVSCGKLGDLNHWIDANLNGAVCIDYNRDNLENTENGAAVRILDKMTTEPSNFLENILLIYADSSKKYSDSSAGKDELNKYYLDILYGNTDIDTIRNSKLRKFYNLATVSKGNGFDIVSCQFSLHYFFENEGALNTLLENISNSLQIKGKFVGTCLNGSKVFNLLKNENTVVRFNSKTNQVVWSIKKLYSDHMNFTNDNSSLGMPIDVYFESIGTTTKEYLVNIEYLIQKCSDFNLRLIRNGGFNEAFEELKISKLKYGKSLDMTEELKVYSFLHEYFVFERV